MSNSITIGSSVFYLGVELNLSKKKSSDIFKFIILENEFWSYAVGWTYIYKISSLGRIKRSRRLSYRNNKAIQLNEMFLKINKSRDGYSVVSLSHTRKTCNKYIHRLVSLSFINNPDVLSLNEINHKNGNKNDNRMCNLEWSDRSKNILHGYKNGLFKIKIGDASCNHKLTSSDVIEIKTDKKNNHKLTLKYFAEKYNVDDSTISLILRNKTWKHIKI